MLALAIWAHNMSASSNLREERLAQIVARFNAADNHGERVGLAELGISDEDVALLNEAIDSGELWQLLEAHPELDLAPTEAFTGLKWSDLVNVKAAALPRRDAEADEN